MFVLDCYYLILYLTGLNDRCGTLCWYGYLIFTVTVFISYSVTSRAPRVMSKASVNQGEQSNIPGNVYHSVGQQWVQRFKYHFGPLLSYSKIRLFYTSTLMQIKLVFTFPHSLLQCQAFAAQI